MTLCQKETPTNIYDIVFAVYSLLMLMMMSRVMLYSTIQTLSVY